MIHLFKLVIAFLGTQTADLCSLEFLDGIPNPTPYLRTSENILNLMAANRKGGRGGASNLLVKEKGKVVLTRNSQKRSSHGS